MTFTFSLIVLLVRWNWYIESQIKICICFNFVNSSENWLLFFLKKKFEHFKLLKYPYALPKVTGHNAGSFSNYKILVLLRDLPLTMAGYQPSNFCIAVVAIDWPQSCLCFCYIYLAFLLFFICLFNPSLCLWLNNWTKTFLFRQGSEVKNFWYDVLDLCPLQKEKKIKKQRKGLGPDYSSEYQQTYREIFSVCWATLMGITDLLFLIHINHIKI